MKSTTIYARVNNVTPEHVCLLVGTDGIAALQFYDRAIFDDLIDLDDPYTQVMSIRKIAEPGKYTIEFLDEGRQTHDELDKLFNTVSDGDGRPWPNLSGTAFFD